MRSVILLVVLLVVSASVVIVLLVVPALIVLSIGPLVLMRSVILLVVLLVVSASVVIVLPVVFLPVVVLLRCCLRSGQHEENNSRRADHPESDPNAASALNGRDGSVGWGRRDGLGPGTS